jgi:protoheme IX farnesyltransferase
MEKNNTVESLVQRFSKKTADYVQLIKLRLTLLVVFSSAMAYLWATDRNVDTLTIWLLSSGGFLITASSNIFNQIIEARLDGLMKRTAKRPLPDGRISKKEAFWMGLLTGMTGLLILSKINFLSIMLGAAAMMIYIFLYTPLKTTTWLAVVPGAIAGSLPVVIGCIAASNSITHQALLLFSLQFLWQFPHTWSIAWLLNDDYNRAGIKLLPANEKNKKAASLITLSTFLMIPAAFLLYMYELSGILVTGVIALAGIILLVFSIQFYQKRTDKSAVRLMLNSLAYLPLVLLILVAEKFFL